MKKHSCIQETYDQLDSVHKLSGCKEIGVLVHFLKLQLD